MIFMVNAFRKEELRYLAHMLINLNNLLFLKKSKNVLKLKYNGLLAGNLSSPIV